MRNTYLNKNLIVLLLVFICLGQNVTSAQGGQSVLIVDAGVLPNSKFYFLDMFDEWMQENIFTFGISSLRTEAIIANASERVSEIQILNAQGLLSKSLVDRSLGKWQKDLSLVVNILGSQMEQGRNPIYLIKQTLDVIFLSEKALGEEIRDDVLLSSDDKIELENYLWEVENKTLLMLAGDDEMRFEPSLEALVNGQIYYAEKNITERKRDIGMDEGKGKMRFAGLEMVTVVENGIEKTKKFLENKDYRNALDEMKDVRSALHLSESGALIFDEVSDIDSEVISENVRKAEEIVNNSGLLDVELINSARKDLLERINPTK